MIDWTGPAGAYRNDPTRPQQFLHVKVDDLDAGAEAVLSIGATSLVGGGKRTCSTGPASAAAANSTPHT